ncbi:ABC transporter substrate-binding protein [Azospirillum cavernae]|uniref:ABC transporter substrate-binding protein n=1 Tax=Azospirillum cavernae TaxID=2320860 RepID=A0A418VSN1_9PROT|nr:ABC transporter substrate-binding protein [Azospirillum cavernae]RJF79495.1 ABC transporter substrate-binding protein [Azospirillum cavernae]
MRSLLLAGTALLTLASGAAQAQVSNDVVRIGVLNDRSGIYADLAGEGSAIAARMAAEEFGGKVAGAPIEIVVADHQNKADIAASKAREWVDTGNVDVIADVPNSAAALAVQGITKEKKRIFLMSGPGATALTGAQCSPYGFHWTYDNYAMAAGTGRALFEQGKKSWYFVTADYAFGQSLEEETTKMVNKLGGKVVGTVRHPLGSSDFSSFLLQAQASKADVIGFANAGGDATNAVKQAAEFGITQSGQSLAGLLLFITDVHALGLSAAQGLMFTEGFYWNLDDQTRDWSKKFEAKAGKKPTMVQAGVYSAVKHYLKAVEAAKTDDSDKVAAKMRELPVEDMFAKKGKVAANGRMFHDMYLVRVKKPGESKGPWDYYDVVKTIPAETAFLDPALSGCPLVK